MKVFITGGAGCIGSHVADRLLARGDEVLVVDNYATGRRDNLTKHEKLEVIEGDVSNRELIEGLVARFKPDIVVHAAAAYKDMDNWYEDAMSNVVGTVNVVKSCIDSKVPRLIYFQTALCYGLKPLEQPISLNHPLLPGGSSYAISKTAGEYYIELSGLDFVTFRIANAYGPRNLCGPLPSFYRRISANQDCFVADTRRDFVYMDDVIDCIMLSIDGKGRGSYHISSGKDLSIKELFDETVRAMGKSVDAEVKPRLSDDVYSILLDPSKTERDFNWVASTPLSVGIKKTIEYYNKFGVEETFTHLKQYSRTEVTECEEQ